MTTDEDESQNVCIELLSRDEIVDVKTGFQYLKRSFHFLVDYRRKL